MSDCPCGSGQLFENCCGPLLAGDSLPETAEALMRSRYTAYVKGQIPYLGETLHPDHRGDYDEPATRRWAEQAEWLGLEVRALMSAEEEGEAVVEFIASFREKGVHHKHHELARFQRHEGRWVYLDGTSPAAGTLVHEGPKTGRNDPCPCGSGKKFKKCCGR